MASVTEHTLLHFLCVRAYQHGIDSLTVEERTMLFKYGGFDYSGYLNTPVARAEERRRALTLVKEAESLLARAEVLFAGPSEGAR